MSESKEIEHKMNPMRVPTKDEDYNRQTSSPGCSSCTTAVAATVCIGAVMAASIVWIVYAIIALSGTTPSDYQDTCPSSNIWASLLGAVISIGLSNLDNMCGSRDEHGTKKPNVVIIVIQMGSATFSSVEVFRGCAMEHLNNTLAYKLQFWMVVITYSIWAICVITACGLCYVACREQGEEHRRRQALGTEIIQKLDTIKLDLKNQKTYSASTVDSV